MPWNGTPTQHQQAVYMQICTSINHMYMQPKASAVHSQPERKEVTDDLPAVRCGAASGQIKGDEIDGPRGSGTGPTDPQHNNVCNNDMSFVGTWQPSAVGEPQAVPGQRSPWNTSSSTPKVDSRGLNLMSRGIPDSSKDLSGKEAAAPDCSRVRESTQPDKVVDDLRGLVVPVHVAFPRR
ncbi:hypothetical protein E2562_008723 [Oryza meyeriana var. granulata]|uniref:Uncharacterized protein n=1 Tax=Oryza meyeriana var. granulata TaxID=110450 RepID=A0A6G1F5K2_9ORYZ|nr:hypothetical protein E2562_008723 [Oryza meyeriana var. granulata]